MIKRSKESIQNGVSLALLKGCVSEHQKTVDRFQKLDEYYIGKHDILNRKQSGDDAPNNRIVANFPKYITDTAIGYMFGNPVMYQSDEPGALDDLLSALERADADTHDAELGKDLSVFGVGFELAYMSGDEIPAPKLAILDPREAFVVYDDTVACNPLFGVYYYKKYNDTGESAGYDMRVYTATEELSYRLEEIGGEPVFKDTRGHYFGGIPLVQYWNNEEGMGDFEHVIDEINAYNVLQSDRVNDKERFVSAFLVIENAELDDETSVREMLSEGVIKTFENSKVYYLTKTLNEAETEILKNSLSDDIHKFSLTPDFTDENFSGNASGVALKYKLLSLEYLAKVKERFFNEGLRERLKLFARILSMQGKAPVDAEGVKIVFNRTLPVNEFETAQTVAAYASSGTVSRETLLTQISFVKDKDAELEKLEADRLLRQTALDVAFGGAGNVDDVRL